MLKTQYKIKTRKYLTLKNKMKHKFKIKENISFLKNRFLSLESRPVPRG